MKNILSYYKTFVSSAIDSNVSTLIFMPGWFVGLSLHGDSFIQPGFRLLTPKAAFIS